MTTTNCGACGGPLSRAVTGCVERPGSLPLSAIIDELVTDGDMSWLQDLPTECPSCFVSVDQPHHLSCEFDRCDEHSCRRDQCECDRNWLASRARAERPRWPTWLHLPRLRRPRRRRRTFRYGETITRQNGELKWNP